MIRPASPRTAALFASTLFVSATAAGAVDDLRITEVDPLGDAVEVTNASATGFTVPSPLPFCHLFNYSSVIPGGTIFAPGESKTFTVAGLANTASDIWLYRNGSDFGSAANIVTGMQYGASSLGRASVAAAAGIWSSAAAFAGAPSAGETLQLRSANPESAASWESHPATSDAWFATGAQIADPIAPQVPNGSIQVAFEVVAGGLVSPLGLVEPEDGTGRLLVHDQGGTVHVLQSGSLLPAPFMDVAPRLVPLGVFGPGTFDERGFLGFALHPDFASNGKVYTYTSEPVAGPADFTVPLLPTGSFDHQSVVAEWTVSAGDPNAIDPASRRELLRVDEPQFNHNAGGLHFGPDGHLYIAFGDGGGADDEDGQPFIGGTFVDGHGAAGNGQSIDSILGKILRIDVDGSNSANSQYGIPSTNPFVGTAGLDEIFAYGFRNPYSFSFDRGTGELYVGDVGQNDIEEINKVQSGSNCGWRLKEGAFFFDPAGIADGFVTTLPVAPLPAAILDPFAQYDHDDGLAVVGGFVYRGGAIPALAGMYVCGDFSSDFVAPLGKILYVTAAGEFFRLDSPPLNLAVKGFGEDLAGELYVLASGNNAPAGSSGVVLKIVPPVQSGVGNWVLY